MIPGIVASTWTPRKLPSLVGWWDASDAATITASGSPLRVSQWSDKSGNGWNATQGIAGIQPEYDPSESLGGIFVGPDSRRLNTTLTSNRQPITVFIAARRTGDASNVFDNTGFLFGATIGTTYNFGWDTASGGQYFAQRRDGGGFTSARTGVPDTNRTVFTLTGTSSAIKLRINKDTEVSTAHTRSTFATSFVFGGVSVTNVPGWFHEVIMVDAELSVATQDTVVDYLTSKWSI